MTTDGTFFEGKLIEIVAGQMITQFAQVAPFTNMV